MAQTFSLFCHCLFFAAVISLANGNAHQSASVATKAEYHVSIAGGCGGAPKLNLVCNSGSIPRGFDMVKIFVSTFGGGASPPSVTVSKLNVKRTKGAAPIPGL
ncbi:hypothetical protein TYRP_014771 [Tyrophagus putrescentiae]|nr:hypothetical protein TYRP_014771 [Tyrophagus putrescentiae]